MVRISRAGLEFPRFVPLTRGIVFGMDQQTANPGDVGSLCGAQQGILEQGLSLKGEHPRRKASQKKLAWVISLRSNPKVLKPT